MLPYPLRFKLGVRLILSANLIRTENGRQVSKNGHLISRSRYDVSGAHSATLVEDVKSDWRHLVDDLKVLEGGRYLHPVVIPSCQSGG